MKNILVTGTGGRSFGAGILHSLIRSNEVVSKRWNVIAADADSFAWGLYKTKQHLLLPFANSPEYLPKLHEAIKEFNLDAIIPGTEVETELLAKNKKEFPDTVILCNRADLMPLMMDKTEMLKAFKSKGINFIPSCTLTNYKEVVKEWDFPMVLKPVKGTGGSRGLQIISSTKDIEDSLEHFGDQKSNYCLQPFIGTADSEYTVGILSDKNASLIDSIVLKRKLAGLSLLSSIKKGELRYDISTGYSQGFIIKHPKIQEFCEQLAQKFNSVGPLNIQLREHDGEFYVFDFHPRFSGTTPMRSDVGFNEVDLLLRNYLLDESFSRIDYQTDVAAIRTFEHVIVPIKDMAKK